MQAELLALRTEREELEGRLHKGLSSLSRTEHELQVCRASRLLAGLDHLQPLQNSMASMHQRHAHYGRTALLTHMPCSSGIHHCALLLQDRTMQLSNSLQAKAQEAAAAVAVAHRERKEKVRGHCHLAVRRTTAGSLDLVHGC